MEYCKFGWLHDIHIFCFFFKLFFSSLNKGSFKYEKKMKTLYTNDKKFTKLSNQDCSRILATFFNILTDEHSPNLQFITINPSKSLPLTHVRYWYLMVYASSVSTNIASWNFGPIFTFYLIKQNYDHMTNHVFCFDFNWLVNIGTIHTVTPISKMVSFNEIRNGLQLTTCY